jgi:hypothetical protein
MTMATMTPAALPAVPPDVAEFAAESGAAPFLNGIYALAREIFPDVPLTIELSIDPEIPEWRQVLIQARVPEFTTEQFMRWRDQWAEGLFANCPATHAHLFQLEIWPA